MQSLIAPLLGAPGSLAPILSRALLVRAMGSSAKPPDLGVAEELAERVKDKKLLRTHGYIGGDWKAASDGATYQARRGGGVARAPLMHDSARASGRPVLTAGRARPAPVPGTGRPHPAHRRRCLPSHLPKPRRCSTRRRAGRSRRCRA
jgi:hypothetical protein